MFAFFKRIREHILSPISEKRIYAFINFRELTQNLWNSQNFPFKKDSDPKVQMINMDILQGLYLKMQKIIHKTLKVIYQSTKSFLTW